MRALKITLWSVGGVVLLLVIAALIFAAVFDPNKYKPEAIEFVREKYNRTLVIDGGIDLSFFPKLGATLGKVSLSEPGSPELFARMDEATMSVALLPLLYLRVVFDRIALQALEVELVRYADGHTNFDDLIKAKDTKEETKPVDEEAANDIPFVIDISGMTINNAAVGWRDEMSGTQLRLSNVDLSTGRIAEDVPDKLSLSAHVQGVQPKMDLAVKMATGYRLNIRKSAYTFTGLDLAVQGDVPGVVGLAATLGGDVSVEGSKRINLSSVQLSAASKDGLDARLTIPKLLLTPQRSESAPITGELKLSKPEQTVSMKIALAAAEAHANIVEFPNLGIDLDSRFGETTVQGKIGTPLMLDLQAKQAQLPQLRGDLAVSGPTFAGAGKLGLDGFVNVDWGRKNANTEIAAKIDESTLRLRAGIVDYEQPAITFDLEADRLDVDRYLAANKPVPTSPSSPASPTAATEAKPFDLAVFKSLNANGQMRVGALTASKLHVQDFQLDMKTAGGRMELAPITAKLYQGQLNGSAVINANNNSFALKQSLSGVAIGPLLRDVASQDLLEGTGSVNLDLRTAGNTVNALKRALAGTASLNLRDGALKGINLAEVYRRARALVSGSAQDFDAISTEKTDFTALAASFVIREGIAHNQDLSMQSPFVRLSGAGDINIVESRMNYNLRATMVSTPVGQDAKASARPRGVSVPVQVSGPLDGLKYRVDFAALATETLRDEARKRIDEVIERRVGSDLKGPARDLLRGILGK